MTNIQDPIQRMIDYAVQEAVQEKEKAEVELKAKEAVLREKDTALREQEEKILYLEEALRKAGIQVE